MSDENAFVGSKRARTYGALFRSAPGGRDRCDAKKREREISRIRPVFKSFRTSRQQLASSTRENGCITLEARQFSQLSPCFAREDIAKVEYCSIEQPFNICGYVPQRRKNRALSYDAYRGASGNLVFFVRSMGTLKDQILNQTLCRAQSRIFQSIKSNIKIRIFDEIKYTVKNSFIFKFKKTIFL